MRKIVLLVASCLFGVSAHAERIRTYTIFLNGGWGDWSSPELACERFANDRWNTEGVHDLQSYLAYPYQSNSVYPNACRVTYGYNDNTQTGSHLDFIYGGYRCDDTSYWSDAQQACVGQPPYNSVVEKNKGKPPHCGVGNPINPATGNKYQKETDLSATLPGGVAFSRDYNSQSEVINFLGPNWLHSYSQKITMDHTNRYLVQRPDGKVYLFVDNTGVFSTDADITDRLEHMSDGFRYTRSDNSVEVYNSTGRLESISNAQGQSLTLTYNGTDYRGRDLLESITDAYGASLSFSYDNYVRISTITGPDGGVYRYGYGDDNNLISVTYPDNSIRQYHYDDASHHHALTGITDENGDRFATWGYDDQGRAILSEHAGGAERVTLTYNADGSTSVTDVLGATRTYHFESQYGVFKATSVSGDPCTSCGTQVQNSSYDGNGFLASQSDWNGNLTSYVHNSRGLQTSRTEAAGTPDARTITTEWHPDFRRLTLIAEPGRDTVLSYDNNGLLKTRTERDTTTGASRTWTYTYTSQGLLDTLDGPRTDVSDITDYDYNAQGHRIRITNALGHITQITSHDGHGRPLTLIDANGITTTLSYHVRGWLATRTVGSGTEAALTQFDYDNVGNLTRITQPNGATLDYAYDAAHRLIKITDNLGNHIDYTLDAMGNRTNEAVYDSTSSLRRSQSQVFNQLGQLIEHLGAEGQSTQYGYDNNGNRISLIDPRNGITTYSFDALNRLSSMLDAAQSTTSYGYDARDNLTSVTDARALVTSYIYDGLNNLIEQTSPDTGTTAYTHDAAGNRLTKTDARGITTAYYYDTLNRLISVQYPDPSLNISFSYDQGPNGIGRLSAMSDASGTTSYGYDTRGNIITQSRSILGVTYTTQYAYDLADQLIQMTYPSGRIVDYIRNATGQIITVTTTHQGTTQTVADAISYLPFGPLQSLVYGNGLTLDNSYDLDYNLTEQLSGTAQALRYEYDAIGNLSGIIDLLDNARSQHFNYNSVNRLIHEQGSYGERQYSYDPVGNRTQRIRHDLELDNNAQPVIRTRTQHYSYAEQANQLLQINQKPLEYDANGNLNANHKANKSFSYNNANRLASFSRNATLKAHYIYNGYGERVVRHKYTAKGTITLHYHYNQYGQLLGLSRYNGAGKLKVHKEIMWIDQRPLAQFTTHYTKDGGVKSQQRTYLHPDHLNTPRLATDEHQKVVWRWSSDAFGQGSPDTDADGDGNKTFVPLRFPGQIASEGGVYYNYFRDYDPSTGRYIQSDPIGLRGGLNTYVYVDGNPLYKVDPLGLYGYSGTIGRGFSPQSNRPSYYESCPDKDCNTSFSECYEKCISYWMPVENAGWVCAAASLFGGWPGAVCAYYGGWTFFLTCNTTCARYSCAMDGYQ